MHTRSRWVCRQPRSSIWMTSVFEALAAGGIPQPDFAVSEAVETALSRRLDLINQADMVLDAQRAVYVATDALGPDWPRSAVSTSIPGATGLPRRRSARFAAGPGAGAGRVSQGPDRPEPATARVRPGGRHDPAGGPRGSSQTAGDGRSFRRPGPGSPTCAGTHRQELPADGLRPGQQPARVLDALQHLHDARNECRRRRSPIMRSPR